MNDGDIYGGLDAGSTGATLTPADGSVVTIQLDTSGVPGGYGVKSVVSLTGTAQGRGTQTYDVAVATVSSGGVYAPLFSVVKAGGGNGETQVTTQDDQGQPLATGVSAIQITFHNANSLQSMYREFDVFTTGAAPSLTTQPQNQLAESGASASFWVVASAPGPLLYQWLFNGAPIDPGLNSTATTTNLVLFSVGLADIGAYSVAVDSASGMTVSSNASLKVTMGGALLNVLNGPNGTFTVSSNNLINVGSLYFSSIAIDDTNNAEYGSTVDALNDGLIYSSNGAGYTDWTLTPAAGTVVTINLNTNISVHGYDLTSIVSLTGTAQNRAQQSYDVAVAQVGSSTFTLLYSVPPVGSTAANVEAQVIAANATTFPIATNVAAIQITFNAVPWTGGGLQGSMYREFDVYGGPSGAVPTIAGPGQPQSEAVFIGGTAMLTVSAQSTAGSISYQWQVYLGGGWTNLAGATSATLTLSQVTTNNSGSYRVLVSNANGTTASLPATLTVGTPAELGIELLPGIIIQGA